MFSVGSVFGRILNSNFATPFIEEVFNDYWAIWRKQGFTEHQLLGGDISTSRLFENYRVRTKLVLAANGRLILPFSSLRDRIYRLKNLYQDIVYVLLLDRIYFISARPQSRSLLSWPNKSIGKSSTYAVEMQ